MSNVTATRIVPADPASTALLLTGPAALDFWPGVSRVQGVTSPVQVHASLAGDDARRIIIRSQPPRRTPTAYITEFSADPDGLPTATCRLRVTRQGWLSDVDTDLAAHRVLWAGGGDHLTMFATSYEELLRLTDGTAAAVA